MTIRRASLLVFVVLSLFASNAVAQECFRFQVRDSTNAGMKIIDIERTCAMSQFGYGWENGPGSIVVTCCPAAPNPYPVEVDISCMTGPRNFGAGTSWTSSSVAIQPLAHEPTVSNLFVRTPPHPYTGKELEFDYEFPGVAGYTPREILIYLLPRGGRPVPELIWRGSQQGYGLLLKGHAVVNLSQHASGTLLLRAFVCGSSQTRVTTAIAELPCDSCEQGQPPSCRTCVGDPVRTSSGNMRFVDVDPLPSPPQFPLRRTYDSRDHLAGVFGDRWSSLFDGRVDVAGIDGIEYATVTTEDGDEYAFESVGGGYQQITPRKANGTTLNGGGGAVTHTSADGTRRREFGAGGWLTRLIDVPSGREVTIERDASGLPTRLSDSQGNVAWSITTDAASRRITSIAVEGRPDVTWTYQYTGAQLASVTSPAGLWRTYEKDPNIYVYFGLGTVRDGQGNIIESHHYASSDRALSSYGPSGDLQSITYEEPQRLGTEGSPDERWIKRTLVQKATGATETHTLELFDSQWRTIEISGGCASCGSGDGTFTYDAHGNSTRWQDARGYVGENVYSSDGKSLLIATTFLKPASCDPETDAARCRMDSPTLAAAVLAPTAATVMTTYEYADASWPKKPTSITTASVGNPGSTRRETLVYDAITGAALVHTVTGWTGTPAVEQSRTTATALYDGAEPAAFAPGGAFQSAWLTLPQPGRERKSANGPRTDVSDVSQFVYYPVDAAVPGAWRGHLAATRNAAGQITRFEDYDVFGNAARVVDPNGVVNESTYDTLGRLVTSTVRGVPGCDTSVDPLCAADVTSSRTYFGSGRVATETRPGGAVTAYTYDQRLNVRTISRGPGASDLREQIEYTYNAANKKSLERILARENGVWVEKKRTSYVYDDQGQLTQTTHADLASVGYAYGPDGQVTSVRDENHTAPNTGYVYEPGGRLKTVTQALAGAPSGEVSTGYAYDLHGNLRTVTDPNGNVTTYVYDDFGQMLRQESSVTGTTTYSYDAAGNLLTTTDANGATTTRSFDVLGRVTSSIATRGSQSESVSWTYDAGTFGIGRMTSMTDPAGSTAYVYNRRGLLASEAKTVDTATYTTAFRYDANGNRTRLVYPSGRAVDYTFDYADRPYAASTESTSIVSSAKYLPFGPATEIVYGNGTTKRMPHDSRYRPQTNELLGPAGSLASYSYGYDAAGNITRIHDALDATYNRDFGYDGLNRLTTANSGSSLWGAGSYSYDAMGNMLTQSLGSMRSATFSYLGTTPKMTSVVEDGSSRSVAFDGAGNEVSVGSSTSTYTPRNLLATVGEQSYFYDGRGVRTTQSHPADYLASLALSTSTLYTNQSGTATVTLASPAGAGGTVVRIQSSTAHLIVPATVVVPEGGTTAIFGISWSAAAPAGTTATLTASYVFSRAASLVLAAGPSLGGVSIAPSTVTSGSTAAGSLSLEAPAPQGGAPILLSSNVTSVSVPASVTIPTGETAGSFTATTTAVSATTVATISANYGETATATLTVTPFELQEILLQPAVVTGGANAQGSVTFSGPAPAGGAAVSLSSSNTQAATVPASISIPEGSNTQAFVATTTPVASETNVTLTASHGGVSRSTALSVMPCALGSVAPPTIPSAEVPWIDDVMAPGLWDPEFSWSTAQKASGSRSLYMGNMAGPRDITRYGATTPLRPGTGEGMVVYLLLNPCAMPREVVIRWHDITVGWKGLWWGEALIGGEGTLVSKGALPAGGSWVRIELPASEVGLENRDIGGLSITAYGGELWVDRFATVPSSCVMPVAAAPTIPTEEVSWIDDAMAPGMWDPPVWTTTQKASGTRSVYFPNAAGARNLPIRDATTLLQPGTGDRLVVYLLLNPCAMPREVVIQWFDTVSGWKGLWWGEALMGGEGAMVSKGALPAGGNWVRIEVPASEVGLENRSIGGINIAAYGGELWVDRFAKVPSSCVMPVAATPTIPSAEIPWIDDATAPGMPNPESVWSTAQKASGTRSVYFANSPGARNFPATGATTPLRPATGDSLVFYLLLNPCSMPREVVIQWLDAASGWKGLWWGEALLGGEGTMVSKGALPAGGSWVRIEVPASEVGLENRDIRGFNIAAYGGELWVDRFATVPSSCAMPVAAVPTIPSAEVPWIDDATAPGMPNPESVWSTAQKASGTRSLYLANSPGAHNFPAQGATTPLRPGTGDSLVVYMLLNPCSMPREVVIQWFDAVSGWKGLWWGEALLGGEGTMVSKGPLPAGGSWVRIEVPASEVGLENRDIRGFNIAAYGGELWVDRFATVPSSCAMPVAAAPTIPSAEVPWIDDAMAPGMWDPPVWSTTQKASGTRSVYFPNAAGARNLPIQGATTPLRPGTGDRLAVYLLLNPCAMPREVVIQWFDAVKGWKGLWWGEALIGGEGTMVSKGALPAGGSWVRIEVPASEVGLENGDIRGINIAAYGGELWVDRFATVPSSCAMPVAAAPTIPSAEVPWIDDAMAPGMWNPESIWSTAQKASGTQSVYFPNATGARSFPVRGATTPLRPGTGDSLVVYLLLNPCSMPREVVIQWFDTVSGWKGVWWGEALYGVEGAWVSKGALPEGGSWVRIEVPASEVGLENRDIDGINIAAIGGELWIDRFATIGSTPPPLMSVARGGSLFERLRSGLTRQSPPVSLGISAGRLISASVGDPRRHVLYSPELNLLAETESTTAAQPAIAHEYVWFGGQPVAQIASTNNEVTWTFTDHLGTPLVQTSTTAAVVWRAEYDPYGSVLSYRAGATRHQPLRFPGQEYDETSPERAYNIFRWYRAGWGRYTQADPIVVKRPNRLAHPYGYADANPITLTDPLGLFTLRGPFPPGRDVDVMFAVADIVRKMLNSPCCASAEYRERVLNQLRDPDLVIEYDPSLQHCGQTPFVPFLFGLRPRIVIGPAAWGAGCCYGGAPGNALPSTIFHELGHIDGGLHGQIGPEEQQCYGCQPPP